MVLANSNNFYFPHTFLSILLLLWHPDVAVRMTMFILSILGRLYYIKC